MTSLRCRLFGHDETRWFSAGRVTTRCLHCGAESPGWARDPDGPTPIPVTYRTQAERAALAQKVRVLTPKKRRTA